MQDRVQSSDIVWRHPTIDWSWDEYRFTWMAVRNKFLTPWRRTPEKKLEQIRRRLLNYVAGVAESEEVFKQSVATVEETWPEMREKLRKNPTLAQFMLEYGVHSEFFYSFLLHVPQATTLEAAFACGYDLAGRMRKIPITDAMYAFCNGDEMFGSIRARVKGEQYYLGRAKQALLIGGGLLPVFRRYDYPLGKLDQKIVVYDSNEGLRSALGDVFAEPLESLGVEYHFKDMSEAFNRLDYEKRFDVVDATGVLSYRKDDAELETMLTNLLKMVRLGGVLVFELEVLTPTLLFDKFVLGWETEPAMKPEMGGIGKAIEKVQTICKDLGAGMVDVVTSSAISVQFAVRK